MKRPRVPESSLEHEIRTLAALKYRARVHKIDVMRGVQVQYEHNGKLSTRRFSEGTPGQPDLVLLWPSPQVLYVECKAKDGRLAPHQRAFHDILRRDGFSVIVPRSWAEVEAWIRENRGGGRGL